MRRRIERPKEQWSHSVKGDALEIIGEGCLRHRVEFVPPVRVRYTVMYGEMDENLSKYSSVRMAVCDDTKGNMVTHLDLMALVVEERGGMGRESPYSGESEVVEPDSPYDVLLENDGTNARLQVAGRPEHLLTAGRQPGGTVAIYWKTESPNQLLRFVIEGQVAPQGLASFRDPEVARELDRLFKD